MFSSIEKIWKYIINLSPEKRTTGLLFGLVLVFGVVTYYFYKQNQSHHKEIKVEYKRRLDTCETHKNELQVQISYWKDSLASEKLIVALKEIEEMRKIANIVKHTETKMTKQNTIINNKIKQIKNEE